MFGAIVGDIIGSPYQKGTLKTTQFPLFCPYSSYTDDSVLTVAVADVLLDSGDYEEAFLRYFHLYPNAGYGESFSSWAMSYRHAPYNSFGNGSAMRVSPVGWAFETLEETLEEARRSALPTHGHPEGIKGAQSTAAAIFLARTGHGKEAIASYIEETFGYNLREPLDSIRPWYSFVVTCQGTMPVAIRAFLESQDWEDAVRLAVSMGGDSDTLACITGSIAEAFYGGVPEPIAEYARRLMEVLAPMLLEVADAFAGEYIG